MEKGKSPFEEGVDAFSRGQSRESCPFPAEDDRRRFWLEGWDKAKLGDELYVDGLP